MAKKQKRTRPKQASSSPAIKPEPVEAAESLSEPAPLKTAQAARPKRQSTAERLEDEYAYIVDDLRRVLILAAIVFGLLIAANLILGRIDF